MTASAGGDDLSLTLVGVPEGFTPQEISGWLEDVAGVARETSRADTAAKPIPHLLHHALTGLLFSQSELWSQTPGAAPCSVGFVRAESEIGFGWVGEAEVSVWLDGNPLEVQWVLIRDALGRVARAWSIDTDHSLFVRLRWSAAPADAAADTVADTVDVDAHWMTGAAEMTVGEQPSGERATGDDELPVPDAYVPPVESEVLTAYETVSEPEAIAYESALEPEPEEPVSYEASAAPAELEARPSHETIPEPAISDPTAEAPTQSQPSGVARWLMHSVPWLRRPSRRPAPLPPPLEPTPEPETAATFEPEPAASHEPAHASHEAEPAVESPASHGPGLAERPAPANLGPPLGEAIHIADERFVPLSAAIETPRFDAPLEVRGPVARRLPEAIPPTPESVEITERAIRSYDVPDPRSLSLPLPAPVTVNPDPDVEQRSVGPPRLPVGGVPRASHPAAPPAPPASPAATPPAPRPVAAPQMPAPVARATPVAAPQMPAPVARAMPVARAVHPAAPPAPPAPRIAPPPSTPTRIESLSAPPAPPAPTFELGKVEVRSSPRTSAAPAAAMPVAPLETQETEDPAASDPLAGVLIEDPRITTRIDPNPDNAPPMRGSGWPSADSLDESAAPIWKKPWAWAAAVGVLIVVAWLVAGMGSQSKRGAVGTNGTPSKVVGFRGPRFKATIESEPAGAHIAIDGTDTEKQTPATVEVPVGDHQITLALPGLGSATYPVTGKKGDQVPLTAKLVGALQVISPDPKAVISVAVDGETRGFAPLELEGMTPGPHEVRFSGPGIASWGRTVEVRIGETYQILTRALESPATGLIDVRATVTDETGENPATGGQVWIDGVLRGGAPQTLELPRGPHSIRMTYRGQQAPIQLIDLPGGNQRFAAFEFGAALDAERPRIVLSGAVHASLDKPAVVSATFEDVGPSEVREMWLHVKAPDGPWRRIQMTLLSSQGTVVGVTPFPTTLLDENGKAAFYVSGLVTQGDEYFTELQQAQADKTRAP